MRQAALFSKRAADVGINGCRGPMAYRCKSSFATIRPIFDRKRTVFLELDRNGEVA